MLCIARLYNKEEANVTVLSHLSTIFHVIRCTGHRDTVGSQKSKHNTDHAVHKTDYHSDMCLKPCRQAQISGYREWLHLHAVRFLYLQRPGMPAFLSVLTSERLNRSTVSNDERRRLLLLTESQAVMSLYVLMSAKAALHHQVKKYMTRF